MSTVSVFLLLHLKGYCGYSWPHVHVIFVGTDSPESTEVSLGDFLAFTSGANRPPAVGFEITPSIMFTDDKRLPFVSTCAISLTLPRDLQTYDAFKEALHLAVLGSHGFGNV